MRPPQAGTFGAIYSRLQIKGNPMIYEVRTYDIKPRSLAEVEKRFGEAYEKRKKYSELAAFSPLQ